MNFGWVKSMFLNVRQLGVKNISHILMTVGTGCSLSALISAIRSAPKALDEWKEKKMAKAVEKYKDKMSSNEIWDCIDIGDLKDCNPTVVETIKACWKTMGPAVALEILAFICFWSAHGIDIRRQAVLAGLCTTAEEALREYQKKVQDMISKDAEKEVRNAIAQDNVDKLPPPSNTVILDGDTDTWFVVDGQYLKTSYLKIKDAQNDANHEMIQNMYISRADVHWLLDPEKKYLKPDKDDGMVGWNVDSMLVLDIDWGSGPDHKPVGFIKYRDKDGFDYPPTPTFCKFG